jgi:hypothetical protein
LGRIEEIRAGISSNRLLQQRDQRGSVGIVVKSGDPFAPAAIAGFIRARARALNTQRAAARLLTGCRIYLQTPEKEKG